MVTTRLYLLVLCG